MQNRDYFGCIVPRFEAVRAPNWSQVEAAWPKWCYFTVLRLSSTYLGIIGGYNGSPHQNGIFWAVIGHILPHLGAVRAQNWSQDDKPCPEWCDFTVLVFSSTYQGDIRGHSGFLYQHGIFLVSWTTFPSPERSILVPS